MDALGHALLIGLFLIFLLILFVYREDKIDLERRLEIEEAKKEALRDERDFYKKMIYKMRYQSNKKMVDEIVVYGEGKELARYKVDDEQ